MTDPTERLAAAYRARVIDVARRRVLLTRFSGSEQVNDLSEPPNCRGLGRIHHFRRRTSPGWVPNPLPIDPACQALGLPGVDELRAQVFQTAACNWRCWYCFVPFALLAADEQRAEWVSIGDLVDLMLAERSRPVVIDLSGGEPGLVPEWRLWLMEELLERGLEKSFYLWSDDNLSTDYFWRELTEAQRRFMATYPSYGHVGCFKGFDEPSFAHNTGADPRLFQEQFGLMRRLIESGLDVYAYVTMTSASSMDIAGRVRQFVDRLQDVDERLPLRTVPLEVQMYSPVAARLNEDRIAALRNQWLAVEAWRQEIDVRFSTSLRPSRMSLAAYRRRAAT